MIYCSLYFFHYIPSGSEVYIYIAFKLFNLIQTFWVAFHELPTISWVNFGPFLLTECHVRHKNEWTKVQREYSSTYLLQ